MNVLLFYVAVTMVCIGLFAPYYYIGAIVGVALTAFMRWRWG